MNSQQAQQELEQREETRAQELIYLGSLLMGAAASAEDRDLNRALEETSTVEDKLLQMIQSAEAAGDVEAVALLQVHREAVGNTAREMDEQIKALGEHYAAELTGLGSRLGGEKAQTSDAPPAETPTPGEPAPTVENGAPAPDTEPPA
jgi:hypothetical protein